MAKGGTLTVRDMARSPWADREVRSSKPVTWAEKQAQALKTMREPYEADIVQIAALAQPNRSRFIASMGSTQRAKSTRSNNLYDGHAIRSFRYLTNGMYSGLSSPNRPWFRFKLPDDDLTKFHTVAKWLAEAQEIVARMLATSNFYTAAKVGYGEIGLFGSDACIMTEALDHETGLTYPVCFPQTFGEYWLGLNEQLEPERLMRQGQMTARQMVQSFAVDRYDPRNVDWSKLSQAVITAWDNGNYDNEFPVMALIEPNDDYDPRRADATGMPWRMIKWEPGAACHNERLLEQRGFHSQPFWAPRWEVTGSEVYGYGPGHDALSDMRVLQLQGKRKGEATDYAVKPPMMAPSTVRLKFSPGSVSHVANVDQANVKPLFAVDYRAIEVISRDAQEIRNAIDEATYARLFMAISNLEGSADRTVAEIAAREEEKLTQLGPVIERVNNEKLAVALDRAFDLAARNGMFPEPPEELQGMPIEVDFISILAQAQRMIGMQQTERALAFTAQLNNVTGSTAASENLDVDGLVRDYWDRAGAPPKGLRDPADRDAERQARAQEAAAMRAAEMAKAAQPAANAMQTLAGTPAPDGQSSLFDRLTGAIPTG